MKNEVIRPEMIHVAMSVYDLADSYNQHIAVVIASIAENTNSPITVHLLYEQKLNERNEEYQQNKLRYEKLAEKYNLSIKFWNIDGVPNCMSSLPTTNLLTPGTFYRLYLPDLLSELDKVIYLDGDIVVNINLLDMWNIDISQYPLAARVDPIFQDLLRDKPRQIIPIYNHMNFSREQLNTYFNAGVLILNLAKIREVVNLIDLSCKFFMDYPMVPRADQDALNYFFGTMYYQLDARYNTFDSEILETPKGRVIHYCARTKPWKAYNGDLDLEYWNYLKLTPWGDKIEDYQSKLTNLINLKSAKSETLMNNVSTMDLINIWLIITRVMFKQRIRRVLNTLFSVYLWRLK